jgi:hypothetical protein
VDLVASKSLVASGSPGQGAAAIGLGGGSLLAGRLGTDIADGTTDRFVCSDTAVMNPGAASIALLFLYQCTKSAGVRTLIGKGPNGSNTGLHVNIGGGTGRLTARLNDGVANVDATHLDDTGDTTFRCGAVVINRTTNTTHVIVNGTTEATASIASVGDASTASGLYIGYGRYSSSDAQLMFLAGLEGAAAEAIGQDAVDAFWLTFNGV